MSGESAFVGNFEITPSIENIDRVCNCLCLRRALRDECDYTVTSNLQADSNIDARNWYGVLASSSIRSVHNIVKSNYCVPSFISQLP